MTTKGRVLTFFTAVLIVANTMLDYNAICEYFDVEPFKLEQFGVGNLVGLIAALAVAVVLFAMAWAAANQLAAGKRTLAIALLAACGALSVAVAAFRLSYDASSASRSISGGAMASLTAADVFFAVMLFAALAGESAVSFFRRLDALEREVCALAAAIERLRKDVDNAPVQVEAAAKVVNARIRETLCAVNSANEAVYESALKRAGELQNSFVGYVEEGKKAREAHAAAIEKLLENMLLPTNGGVGAQFEAPIKTVRTQMDIKPCQNMAVSDTPDAAA